MRASLFAVVAVVASCASATAPTPPPTCVSCHAEVARRYARSRHFSSSTNPSYRASVARSPDAPWCARCHGATSEGIACVACHTGAHHDKVDAAVCARCHTVPLPPMLHAGDDAPLAQITPLESTGACTRCHADHALPAGHDAAAAAAAIRVSVARDDDDDDVVALTIAVRAGHPVPTGDPFRVLTIHTCEDADCSTVVDTRHLGRAIDAGFRVKDTRPKPDAPAVVRLRAGAYVEVLLESLERTPPPEPPLLLLRRAVPD